jgi:hypothetical protein
MTQARDFFERALAQDPNNIEALLGTSFVDCVRASSFFADERASLYAAVEVASIIIWGADNYRRLAERLRKEEDLRTSWSLRNLPTV